HVLVGVGSAMGLVVAKLVPVGVDQEGARGGQATALARGLDGVLTGQGGGGNGDGQGEASRATGGGTAQYRIGLKGGQDGLAAAKAAPIDGHRRGRWASDL